MPESEHNPGELPPDYEPPTYTVPWANFGCAAVIAVVAFIMLAIFVIVVIVPSFQVRR